MPNVDTTFLAALVVGVSYYTLQKFSKWHIPSRDLQVNDVFACAMSPAHLPNGLLRASQKFTLDMMERFELLPLEPRKERTNDQLLKSFR